MVKKVLAVVALAILAIFAVPAPASAVGYVPGCATTPTVTGSATPSGVVNVAFCAGTFFNSENVAWTVNGPTATTLSVFKAVVTGPFVNAATPVGAASVNVTLPANAAGTYVVTAVGQTSAIVGTATFTVVVASAGLAGTGYDAPMLLIWSAAGALLLGIGLVVVLSIVRRKHAIA